MIYKIGILLMGLTVGYAIAVEEYFIAGIATLATVAFFNGKYFFGEGEE